MDAFPKCPMCGSLGFFVKDPADEYETRQFTLGEGKAVCSDPTDAPLVANAAESFCSRCSWHGRIPGVNQG